MSGAAQGGEDAEDATGSVPRHPWREPIVPADVPAALADLAAAFAALGVRWYVFGAQAVIAAGVPRLTADIDVTVELPRGGPRALIAALGRAGII